MYVGSHPSITYWPKPRQKLQMKSTMHAGDLTISHIVDSEDLLRSGRELALLLLPPLTEAVSDDPPISSDFGPLAGAVRVL